MTIDLYTYTTPNGRKASIVLEELGLDYSVNVINIGKGDQFTEEYVKINPNSKIPAIVDRDADIAVFESGAILLYLAEKTGKLLPSDTTEKYQVIQWLMWQMGGVGPMFGQFNHFNLHAPDKIPYAIERYKKEVLRLYGVLNKQLEGKEYICDDYSIADIANYPWIAIYEVMGITLDGYENVQRWLNTVGERPGVQKGMKVPDI